MGKDRSFVEKMRERFQNPSIVVECLLHEMKFWGVRHYSSLNLIASENYPSEFVREALKNPIGHKYAEGTPGKRYYAGCEEVIDEIEKDCQEQALNVFVPKEFRDDYIVNVQPHSGTQANLAAYLTLLSPGDTILSLALNDGGHLSHGHPKNLSGMLYNIEHYGLDPETGFIDYDRLEAIALETKPQMIVAGFSAYSRDVEWERLADIARRSGSYLMADIAHTAGLIVAGLMNSPFGYADIVTTTTHKTLRGPRGGMVFTRKDWARKLNSAVMPGVQGGPAMNSILAKLVALEEAKDDPFKEYAQRTIEMSKELARLLAEYGFHIVSGGTDSHQFLIDLSKTPGLEGMTGREAEKILERMYVWVNRNTVPGETRSPQLASGIRIGLAALATRDCQVSDMEIIAVSLKKALFGEEKLSDIDYVLKDLTYSLAKP